VIVASMQNGQRCLMAISSAQREQAVSSCSSFDLLMSDGVKLDQTKTQTIAGVKLDQTTTQTIAGVILEQTKTQTIARIKPSIAFDRKLKSSSLQVAKASSLAPLLSV
jgi:hypothetical protein